MAMHRYKAHKIDCSFKNIEPGCRSYRGVIETDAKVPSFHEFSESFLRVCTTKMSSTCYSLVIIANKNDISVRILIDQLVDKKFGYNIRADFSGLIQISKQPPVIFSRRREKEKEWRDRTLFRDRFIRIGGKV